MREQYTLKLELLSDALIASGEGQGAIIDSDILYDETGLPYIPGRRLKGCLREAAREAQIMFNHANMQLDFDIEQTFGKPGTGISDGIIFGGLYPEKYEANKAWLTFLQQNKQLFNAEDVLSALSSIRSQIAIESDGAYRGVTRDHSLRTLRVLHQGFHFEGQLEIPGKDHQTQLNTILLACQQVEDIGIGAKRQRGLGRVKCELWHRETNLSQQKLKELFANV